MHSIVFVTRRLPYLTREEFGIGACVQRNRSCVVMRRTSEGYGEEARERREKPMLKMTPEHEAEYALEHGIPRSDLVLRGRPVTVKDFGSEVLRPVLRASQPARPHLTGPRWAAGTLTVPSIGAGS